MFYFVIRFLNIILLKQLYWFLLGGPQLCENSSHESLAGNSLGARQTIQQPRLRRFGRGEFRHSYAVQLTATRESVNWSVPVSRHALVSHFRRHLWNQESYSSWWAFPTVRPTRR